MKLRSAGLLACCALLCGCAIFGKEDPLEVRYYTPGAAPLASEGEAEPSSAQPFALRLRRTEGAPHLGAEIVFRDSAHEVGFYQRRRWTEKPQEYVTRALARALFEERHDPPLQRSLESSAPTLETQLTVFEVDREQKRVRVELVVLLHRDKRALVERTLQVSGGLSDLEEGEAAAAALGKAMHAAVALVVRDVVAALAISKTD